jgi:hypothetical protein
MELCSPNLLQRSLYNAGANRGCIIARGQSGKSVSPTAAFELWITQSAELIGRPSPRTLPARGLSAWTRFFGEMRAPVSWKRF